MCYPISKVVVDVYDSVHMVLVIHGGYESHAPKRVVVARVCVCEREGEKNVLLLLFSRKKG